MKMKFPRIPFIANLVALLAIVGMLTSCSKSSELAGLVPADSEVIIKFSPRSLIDNAGCKVEDGKLVIPNELMKIIPDKEVRMALNLAGNYTKGINLDEIFMFVYDDDFFAVALLDDPEAVESNLSDFFDAPETAHGYKCYDSGDGLVAIKDNTLWFADSMDSLEDLIEANVKEYISSNSTICNYLSADNTFAAVVPSTPSMGLPSEFRGMYVVANFNLDGKKATGEIGMMDKDGNRMDFSSKFANIDPSFLAYMPKDANMVAAIGGIADPTLMSTIESLARATGMNSILKGLDGTIAFGMSISPNTTIEELERVDDSNVFDLMGFSAVAHYSGNKATENISKLQNMLGGSGVNVTSTAEGVKMSQGGISFYLGAADGYLVGSTFPTKSQGCTDLSSKVKGYPIVIYSAIAPCKLTRSMGMNFGAESMMWLDSDGLKAKGEVTDTDLTIMQAYIQMFSSPEFIRLAGDIYGSNNGWDNDYNFDDDYMEPDYAYEEVVEVEPDSDYVDEIGW